LFVGLFCDPPLETNRLYVKTVCRNHTVLPSVFIPRNSSSWHPPYDYDAAIHQPIISPATTPSGRGMEQARLFLGQSSLVAHDACFNQKFCSILTYARDLFSS
jgi:hypothetical protein